MLIINTIMPELPLLINGNGNPVGGILPVTTAILTETCIAIIAAMPEHSSEPNLSGAPSAMRNARRIIKTYAPITARQPNSPSSSPITLNMKSLSAKGRNRYF